MSGIYKWTDSSGSVHFSDKPHPGAEEITLPKTPTYSEPTLPKPLQLTEAPTTTGYNSISIVQPDDQALLRNTDGSVTVMVATKPQLQAGDKVQILFDDRIIGTPQTSLVFSIEGMNRGSHTFAAQVIDKTGKVLRTSESIIVFMQQPRLGMGKSK